MNPVLSVQNLSLRRDRLLLKNINWTVGSGQHWCILGANGSGKTLLLKTLLAYEAKTEGEIRLMGKAYGKHDWRELRKHIGWISNDLGRKIAPSAKGLQVVRSGLIAGIGYCPDVLICEDSRIEKILQQIGCEHLKEQSWEFCSQGERQRLLIGRALMSEFKILILDEPCSGLDPVTRIHFLQLLQQLIEEDKLPTLILVTHHIEEIIPQIAHVMVMKQGNILKADTVQACLTDEVLSKAFEAPLHINKSPDHYQLTISANR